MDADPIKQQLVERGLTQGRDLFEAHADADVYLRFVKTLLREAIRQVRADDDVGGNGAALVYDEAPAINH